MKKTALPGSWTSPITAQSLFEKKTKLLEINSDSYCPGALVYSKVEPNSGLGVSLFKTPTNTKSALLPPDYTPHTSVHEYGGGAFTIRDNLILFSRKQDGGIYLTKEGQEPELIFKKQGMRFASFCIHPKKTWAVCVCENHTLDKGITNTLVCFDLEKGSTPQQIHTGYDFYSSPTFSPCAQKLAFIAWNNPYMPWDTTYLLIATIKSETKAETMRVEINTVLSNDNECFSEPRFSTKGVLAFTNNKTGFAQLYTYHDDKLHQITDERGDFSTPAWLFNLSRFAFLDANRIAAIITKKAIDFLIIVDPVTRTSHYLDLPFNDYNQIRCVKGSIYTIASSSEKEASLICIDPENVTYQIIEQGSQTALPPSLISKPRPLTIKTAHSEIFAFFYPPLNPEYTLAPQGEKPPLIIKVHSGPTTHSKPSLSPLIQYWTTRGFAFMEVNYRGSSGYGKNYQDQLYGHWGEFDVIDTLRATEFVIREGLINPDKIIIKGSSAGGLTTLMCLVESNLFKGGISYYGITDLEAMLGHTDHKFEAHYNKTLIDHSTTKQLKKRSPLFRADSIHAPVLFFQGGQDRVVPSSQSRSMQQALIKQGTPTAFGFFEEEAHGFRSSTNKLICLEAEAYFIATVLSLPINDNKKSSAIDWNV